MTLEETYRKRCVEEGRTPDLEGLHHAYRVAHAFIRECVEARSEDTSKVVCPYMLARIDGHFTYFVKMVDDMVYPAILTTSELIELGYTKEEEDESYNEDDTRDE